MGLHLQHFGTGVFEVETGDKSLALSKALGKESRGKERGKESRGKERGKESRGKERKGTWLNQSSLCA